MCAKVYQNITCQWECVSIIVYFILLRNNQPVRKALISMESPTQVLSCEICKIEHLFVQNNSTGCFSILILKIVYVLCSVFCNFHNWMYKGLVLNFWNWFWVKCLYTTKAFIQFSSFKLMVPTLCSVFFKPLN